MKYYDDVKSYILGTSLHDISAQTKEKYHHHIYDNNLVEIGLGNFLTICAHDILKTEFANVGAKGEPIAASSICL